MNEKHQRKLGLPNNEDKSRRQNVKHLRLSYVSACDPTPNGLADNSAMRLSSDLGSGLVLQLFWLLILVIEFCWTVSTSAASLGVSWDSRFFPEAMSGAFAKVTGLSAGENGELYAAGSFSSIGNFSGTRGIACWNGQQWSPLGTGVDGAFQVYAVAARANEVYIGGSFTSVSGIPATNIAKWNGTNWSAVGSGIGGNSVRTLAFLGNDLIAGGSFTNVGPMSVNQIAKWDGTNWQALGSGFERSSQVEPMPVVYALATSGHLLYAGGTFTAGGGVPAKNIALWDGGSWQPLGEGTNQGVNGSVLALAVGQNGELYVGGTFSLAGTNVVGSVAEWDGGNWLGLAQGVYRSSSPSVNALLVVDNSLYVGGSFSRVGTNDASGIGMWNGQDWSSLSIGLGEPVLALATSGGRLFASGQIFDIMATVPNNVAEWTGQRWIPLGKGITEGQQCCAVSAINAIGAQGTNVFVGGVFLASPAGYPRYFSQWDGREWSEPGGGIDQGQVPVGRFVDAVTVCGGETYVGGAFTVAGTNNANDVARWDGTNWHALGMGLPDYPRVLAVKGLEVYAGGNFGLLRWDGLNWTQVGFGVQGAVKALAFLGDDLFAGGAFNTAGLSPATNIARWNGLQWSSVGGGADGEVNSLAVCQGALFLGGAFSAVGGVPVGQVAKWDGTNWFDLGGGVSSPIPSWAPSVASLAADERGNVYAAGNFTRAGDAAANFIARWNGDHWISLESGLNYFATAMAVSPGSVYVGGQFQTAGGRSSSHFGVWRDNDAALWVRAAASPSTLSNVDLTYTILYGNVSSKGVIGPIIIRLPVPQGTAFVSASGGGVLSNDTVTWSVGSIPPAMDGQNLTFTVHVNATEGHVIASEYWIEGNDVARAYGPAIYTSLPISNYAPLVTITDPADASFFDAPGIIPISTTVSDPDGIVREVSFYAGTNRLGTVTNQPFSFTWSNAPHGLLSIRAVATDDSGGSTVSLPVTVIRRPDNDNFTNRTPLVGRSFTANGDNVYSTTESGEPNHAQGFYYGPINSVWWTWTAPVSGDVHLTTEGSSFSTTLAVYEGSALTNLTAIAAYACLLCRAQVDFVATGGKAYQIAVDGYAARQGDIVLTLTMDQDPALTNVLLKAMGPITNDSFHFRLVGFPGLTGIIEASANLVDWSPIRTNTMIGDMMDFYDSTTNAVGKRFYRFVTKP